MVLPSLLASPSPSSSIRSPPLRTARRGGAGTLRQAPRRPPILLEITATTIRAGTVVDPVPTRIVPYALPTATLSTTADDFYRAWMPLLQHVLDSLGQQESSKDRKVIVLTPDAVLVSRDVRRTWTEALVRILLEAVGVPAVCVQPTLAVLPYAFPMLSTLLVVHVTSTEAACFVHSNDRSLPYTLQSLPLDGDDGNSKEGRPDEASWPTEGLLTALLKTLEATPLDVRRAAVHNLVFTGEATLKRPDGPLRVAQALQKTLQQGQLPEHEGSPAAGPYPQVLGRVPVSLPALQPLASAVGLIDTTRSSPSMGSYRADLLSWLGATLWASHCHQHDPDSFRWISLPATEA
jgi:hypothetical protein